MKLQFWNLFSTYALTYFGKVNLGIIIPMLLITYNELNMYDMGIVTMGFMGAYAVGQFLHGQISERFNPYVYITAGLILSGVANLTLGFTAGFFIALAVLESCDGFFQAMCWPSVVRANAFLHEKEPLKKRERASTLMGISYQFGAALTVVISAIAVATWGWQAGFWVASVFLIGRGITLYLTKSKQKFETKKRIRTQVEKTVLSFPIVFSGIGLMLLNIVRYGVLTWIPLYYFILSNFSVGDYAFTMTKVLVVPLGGIIGTLLYIGLPFKKDKISMVLLAVMGITWFLFPYADDFMATTLLFIGSLCLYGPHVFLVSTIPSRFTKEHLVASATGFIDGMGYVGTVAIGLLIPYFVLDTTGGWNNVWLFWAIISFVAVGIIAATYFGHFRRNYYIQKNGI